MGAKGSVQRCLVLGAAVQFVDKHISAGYTMLVMSMKPATDDGIITTITRRGHSFTSYLNLSLLLILFSPFATLRAQAHQPHHQTAEPATALSLGVPLPATDYTIDVESWWATHP